MITFDPFVPKKIRLRDVSILTYPTKNDFPILGKEGIIYIDLSTDKTYIWDSNTSTYIEVSSITPVIDNLTSTSTTSALSANQGRVLNETKIGSLVEDATPQLAGDLDTNNHNIKFKDDDKAIFGTGLDAEIYSDGDDLIIRQLAQDKNIIFKINKGGFDTEFGRITGANGYFGIGTDTPEQRLHLFDTNTSAQFIIESDGGNSAGLFFSYEGTGGTGGQNRFNARSANGTKASPSASLSGDRFFRFGASGYTGTGFASNKAAIDFEASENWNNTNLGMRISFKTTANGTTAITENFSIEDDGGIYAYNLLGSAGGSDVRYDTTTKELFYDTSSARYKENITELTDTEWIYNILLREYNRIGFSHREAGIIAEELETVRPQLVNYALFEKLEDGKFKLLRDYENLKDFHDITPNVLTEALLEKTVEIEEDIFEVQKVTKNIIKLPEGVNNSALLFPLLKEVQKLKNRIEILEGANA